MHRGEVVVRRARAGRSLARSGRAAPRCRARGDAKFLGRRSVSRVGLSPQEQVDRAGAEPSTGGNARGSVRRRSPGSVPFPCLVVPCLSQGRSYQPNVCTDAMALHLASEPRFVPGMTPLHSASAEANRRRLTRGSGMIRPGWMFMCLGMKAQESEGTVGSCLHGNGNGKPNRVCHGFTSHGAAVGGWNWAVALRQPPPHLPRRAELV
jgi:hypothetical protein